MKKKILLTVFAVILVLATALTCTACNKKELKLKNNMSADEIMVALGKADIKSFTEIETYSDGSVKTTYYTQNGKTSVKEKDEKNEEISFELYEDGKYYKFAKNGERWTKEAYSLGGNEIMKGGADETQNGFMELLYNLSVGKANEKGYDAHQGSTVRVENNDSIVIETNVSKTVYKDFNKTTLYVPNEIADYKSCETTDIGSYIDSYDGKCFDGLRWSVRLKTYTILSEVDGKPVTMARISSEVKKIYIPKSVVKVHFGYGLSGVEIHYLGTVAEWNNNVTIINNDLSADKIIKCSDGDATVVAPKKGE